MRKLKFGQKHLGLMMGRLLGQPIHHRPFKKKKKNPNMLVYQECKALSATCTAHF